MLLDAGFSLCSLHVSPESLRAVPGRTPCHCYAGLWEPQCCCPAHIHLWWLEGYGHTVSCTSPIPFSFIVVAFYNVCCTRHTSVILDLLMLGTVPNHCANDLCPAPLLPPLAPFACPAAAPQYKFWLPVVVQHALTLAVLRSSSPPWLFCQRALLMLSGSSMRINLIAVMNTSNSVSGSTLRRWGRRPRRTAKMDRRQRVKFR